jgi:catalase
MSENVTIDAELGEVLQENEAQLAQQIATSIAAGIERKHRAGERPALRDAHPRAHGCVQAEFQVEDRLPPHLAQGVFVPGRRYPAWIRFSNGDTDPTKPDAKGDARGMAIKLLDVSGDKILPEERDAQTQDFIMINHPVFMVDDPARYLGLVRASAITNPLIKRLKAFLAIGFRSSVLLNAMISSRIASPLEIRYWSMVPYRLGDPPHKQAVKYSARPCTPALSTIPADPAPHFLRDRMVQQLEASEARFDFLVQPRTSPAMEVENTRVEWKESDAPFFKVATITIPQQQFATPERDRLGENLSFTPWHALPQHRPLGAVNRIRRVVYQTIATLRRDLNGVPPREPRA